MTEAKMSTFRIEHDIELNDAVRENIRSSDELLVRLKRYHCEFTDREVHFESKRIEGNSKQPA
jgi:hypothetical protein